MRITKRTSLLIPVLFSLFVLLSTTACGRKAAPKAPELFAPAPVKHFRLQGTVQGVRLEWQAPQRKANGDPLNDLSRFEIFRAEFVDEQEPDFDTLSELEYAGPQLEEVDEEQKRDTFKGLSAGAKKPKIEAVMMNYLDKTTVPGKRYLYYVVPYGSSRVSGIASPTLLVTFVGEASQVELFVQ